MKKNKVLSLILASIMVISIAVSAAIAGRKLVATIYDLPDPMVKRKVATIYDLPDPMVKRKVATIYDLPDPMVVKVRL